MSNTEINLIKKKPPNPIVAKWKGRSYILLVVVALLFFFDITVLLFTKTNVLVNASDISRDRKELTEEIEKKKQNEGLYLTLLSRLRTIEGSQKRDSPIEELPVVLQGLTAGVATINSVDADSAKVVIDITAQNPAGIEAVIERILGFEEAGYKFADPIVTKTTIDEAGVHNIVLELSLSK